MNTFTFIIALVSLIIGFFIGRATVKRDDTPTFSDPDFVQEAAQMGRQAVQERIERRKARILAEALKQGSITNDGVEDLFCIADSTAKHYLHELTEEGKLRQVGESGRSVRYVPA